MELAASALWVSTCSYQKRSKSRWYGSSGVVALQSGGGCSRLPHPKPRRPQVDANLDLPVHCILVAHGVEAFVPRDYLKMDSWIPL